MRHNVINTIMAKRAHACDLFLFAASSSVARIALIRQDMKMAAKIVATTIMISTSPICKNLAFQSNGQNNNCHLLVLGGGNSIPNPNIAGSRK